MSSNDAASGSARADSAPPADDYRRLFEENPQPLWVYDLETLRFLAVNDAVVERYGYSRAELLGMTIADVRPPEDVPALLANVAAVTPGTSVSQGWHHRKRDGGLIDVEVFSRPLPFAGRRAELVVPVDVTERRRNEAELRRMAAAARAAAERERHFRILIENVSDVIAEVAVSGEVRYVNPAVETVLGYPPAEVADRSIFDWVHAEDLAAARAAFTRRLDRAETQPPTELRFRHRDGGWRLLQTRGAAIRAPGSAPLLVLLARDVTVQKDLETRLRRAEKMEAIGRLAGGVAHDFNNLLTSILGHSELALHGLAESSPLRDHLEQISAAGERAASLTRQLLAFGGRQLVLPQTLDVDNVVANLSKMLSRLLPEDVTLDIAADADAPVRVTADRSQLEQVVMNLVLNARDAMPTGGRIGVRTRAVELDTDFARQHPGVHVGPYVELTVSDTGVGMDAETQRRIFEPFFTTKDPARGTGLGLPSVYAVVEQSGGFVTVDSEPGRGTTFRVYLPRATGATAAAEWPSQQPESSVPDGHETLLLVEDEDQVRAMVFRLLTARGYRVLTAASGVEAEQLHRLHGAKVELMLTDVVLPAINGPDLAARLRALQPELAVLYMSGHADEAVLRRGLRSGEDDFIQKPFSAAALARKVREVLDRAAGGGDQH